MNAEFPKKLKFLFKPSRYKILWGGRGGAKSWGVARALLIQGMQQPLRILCARETMKSIADSVHKLLGDQISEMGLDAHYEVQQAVIKGKNGTEFIFAGLKQNINNLKSYEGCDRVWCEEAATVSKRSLDTLIPTIRKPGSEIWLTYNPELETDEVHRRFVINKPPPGAMVIKVGWEDNPWFPEVLRVEKDHLRLTDPEAFEHVWQGACRSGVTGAIFGQEMKATTAEKRICSVPYDRTRPVDTIWDLGFGDKTAIWFAQAYDGWFNFIDYLEDEGETIHHYLLQLNQRGYVYGFDYLPHDALDTIIHKNLAADKTRSIEGIMRSMGRSVRMIPKTYVVDGINAARTIFPQCRFDEEKCADGLRALRMYQWGPPSPNGVAKREPLHDSASHGADAFRGAAWSLKQPRREKKEPSAAPYRPASAWS